MYRSDNFNSHVGNDAAAPQARNFAFCNQRSFKNLSYFIDDDSLFLFTKRHFTF